MERLIFSNYRKYSKEGWMLMTISEFLDLLKEYNVKLNIYAEDARKRL